MLEAYLSCNRSNLRPHQPRQNILQEVEVEVCLDDFELGVARVEGEGGSFCFAGFDGAGEEVEREELHLGLRAIVRSLREFVIRDS